MNSTATKPADKPKVRTYTVEINAKEHQVEEDSITLARIRQLGSIPPDHKVYREDPRPHDDPEVQEGEVFKLHKNKVERFYSVSPAISGGSW
jgi:hypothetical protein